MFKFKADDITIPHDEKKKAYQYYTSHIIQPSKAIQPRKQFNAKPKGKK